MLPPVKGLIENTLLDWEGRIAAILFLPGCNFRCGYCHARHLLGSGAALESIPFDSILRALAANKGWIDGVVISGGEPTLHAGLEEMMDELHAAGYDVKLDTNGSRPAVLAHLLERGAVQHVAMDVKAPLDESYPQVTGVDCDLSTIAESISLLIDSDIDYEFRTTVCPEYLDADGVMGVARAVRGAKKLVLQAFRPVNCLDPELENVKPYKLETLREFARDGAKYVRLCCVRGDAASYVTA